MKKFIALLLIAVLTLALFACNPQEDPNKDPNKDKEPEVVAVDISAFTKAIAETKPAKQTIDVKTETEIDDLNGHYEITFNLDGSAVIVYSYEKFNSLTGGATEVKSTVTGTVTRNADGSYTGSISGEAASGAGVVFDLSSVKNNCKVEGNTLSVAVAKDSTKAVLGTEFGADVNLVLAISGGKVASFTMAYTLNGNKVTVASKYE